MRIAITFAIAVGLAGCSTLTARNTTPIWTVAAHRNLDDTSACVVKALNTVSDGITHKIETIEPHRVFEVLPQQTLTIGAEIYIVRLISTGPTLTQIELQSTALWSGKLSSAMSGCA